jgi:hypothetical protein
MPVTINASPTNGLVQTADGSGVIKLQSNGVTTNALAWVNFSCATSPATIRSSYNVSSATKNGVGDWTVNFTNAMSDANYAALLSSGNPSGSPNIDREEISAYTTTTLRVLFSMSGVASIDPTYVNVAIFGN